MSLLFSAYHWLLALSGRFVYGNPSRDLTVIGVTGTKGKSTTLALLDVALKEAGYKTALLSSVSRSINDKVFARKSDNTMPGRWQIQKFLATAKKAGCQFALIEVTSQGVVQHRHRFIDWDGAVFLNLMPEHIEAHGSFEKYRAAKLKFFKSLKKSSKKPRYFFINRHDPAAPDFEETARRVRNSEVKFFGSEDVYKILERIKGVDSLDWARADFNSVNAAAAFKVALAFGAKEEVVERAWAKFKGIPGRLEFVIKKPFAVVVDYAHTPDSLRLLYENLVENYKQGPSSRLIGVLGSAGGGRDKWKRPEMGRIAADFCDRVVLTSEDPYDEDPQSIIDEIKLGVKKAVRQPKVYEILDRKEAIKQALIMAKKGDVVALTGMGSQKFFHAAKGKKIPWNEPKIVSDILEKMKIVSQVKT